MALGLYCYALIDPRDDSVFYVGKGHRYISSLIASLLSCSPIMHFLALLALIGTAAASASPGICEYKP